MRRDDPEAIERAIGAEAADGLFRVREDEPAPRIGASHHKAPL
jgi:hypothetical protein